jgi:hypothetical protein
MSTPAITKRLAKLCRKEYHVKFSILALRTALSNQCLYPLSAKTRAPFEGTLFSAASATLFKGMCRVFPFLLYGIEAAFVQDQFYPMSNCTVRWVAFLVKRQLKLREMSQRTLSTLEQFYRLSGF